MGGGHSKDDNDDVDYDNMEYNNSYDMTEKAFHPSPATDLSATDSVNLFTPPNAIDDGLFDGTDGM
eukprot:CAMPEP_0119409168 /NCGR_PEP_ID=MMETSP1335-20130426/2511_1 /TAXON_ID=259385 /ORGANISM="Chrysoculter rhomboideus, Strain RCC1486" /LENGTH=65 /DNA_ID=CAMNT_0007433507 /DNA_START=58 /DNA_END=255 /DNA_ORIENTATION=-